MDTREPKPKPVPEKLCVFCPQFGWNELQVDHYSTLTGDDISGGMYCRAGHFNWYASRHFKDEDEFRAIILTAETCPDYMTPRELPAEE